VDYISSAGVRAIEQAAARLSAEGKVLAVCGAHGATRLCLDMARVPQD
jgi:anti-anti-sigma regulatory factor